jgi:hypothetical protein
MNIMFTLDFTDALFQIKEILFYYQFAENTFPFYFIEMPVVSGHGGTCL